MKKKGFDPFDFVMEHGTMQVGYMGVTGLAGRMPSSPQKGQILSSMGTMRILPTIHATKGIFRSMEQLDYKKRKR